MNDRLHIVAYSDPRTGREYTEVTTSPIALAIREDELTKAGYVVVKG